MLLVTSALVVTDGELQPARLAVRDMLLITT